MQAKWQRPESHLGIDGFTETQSRMLVVLARPAHISPCLAGISNGKEIGTESAAKCAALAFATTECGTELSWGGRAVRGKLNQSAAPRGKGGVYQDSCVNVSQLSLFPPMSPVKHFFAVHFGHALILSWGRHLQ